MQYRIPVGRGPSSNTCPRCAPQLPHTTSVRTMPYVVSRCSSTASVSSGRKKLGHPVPDSNLVSEENNGAPQQTHSYVPSLWQSQYSPEKARSVPALRATWNCSG